MGFTAGAQLYVFSEHFTLLHYGTVLLIQAKDVPLVEVELGFKSQVPQKRPILTAVSKITSPTKIEKLCTWQASILFRSL